MPQPGFAACYRGPPYFIPVINHLETHWSRHTAYYKYGMKFEFYVSSLHFVHFSYCDFFFFPF